MEGNRLTIRFDDNTWMALTEIAEKTGSKPYTISKAFIKKCINDLTDKEGYINIDEAAKNKTANK